MKPIRKSYLLHTVLLPSVILLFGSTLADRLDAQAVPPTQSHPRHRTETLNATETPTIPALFVSDIHFDPFHDPARLPQLVAAPVNQWSAILAAPPSPNQQQAFESLQQQCHARGAELRNSFPGMTVYMALGNNDSGCGDYKLDSGSDFFQQAGQILAQGLPSSEQQDAARQFAAGGYYSVAMAAPMRATRLIVINDTFLSPKYMTCGGIPAPNAGDAQIDWLKKQLNEARDAHQNAWILGHIPPGVNVPSTMAKTRSVCAKAKPEMFLASDALTGDLTANADVIQLAIFAHTHMDELRLLRPQNEGANTSSEHDVAIKMVPSISPVDGNNPAFTIAKVNPSKAILQDYEVISASNQTGIDTTWSLEYDFAKTYHETEFSPASVRELIGEFKNDRDSNQDVSAAYIRNFFVGDRSVLLKPFWPQYVCGLANSTASSFAACMCSTDK